MRRHPHHANNLPITSDVQGWTPEKEVMAYNLEKQYGLPEGTMRGMSWVESQFGRLREHGPTYQGEFQLGPKIREQYHVPQGQSRNWQESMKGGAAYAAQNMHDLQDKIHRAPTRAELYLAHQQGEGAAAKFINHPNTPIGRLTTAQNIRANHGNPAAPARDFSDKFTKMFEAGSKLGQNELWNGPQATEQLGDKQMLANMPGDKASPMASLMAQAVSPGAQQHTMAKPPLPAEASSNQRYNAMTSVSPKPADSPYLDMAHNTMPVANRSSSMEALRPDPMQHADANVLSEPGMSQPQMGPQMEGMAANPLMSQGNPLMSPAMPMQMDGGFGGGLGDMFSAAVPEADMGGLGGMNFGDFNFGGML